MSRQKGGTRCSQKDTNSPVSNIYIIHPIYLLVKSIEKYVREKVEVVEFPNRTCYLAFI